MGVSIISDFLEFQRKEKAGRAVNIYFLQATSQLLVTSLLFTYSFSSSVLNKLKSTNPKS